MSDNNNKPIQVDNLYSEGEQWVQNLGEKTVHAKRMGGKFRLLKWAGILVWAPFFLLPYVTWNGKQAILFDTENRQYHLFDITIFPQDVWMLTLVLLFLAILLAAVTSVLGRMFCGYICFQTVWTDIFTQIEQWVEGAPSKRRKLDQAPMSFHKFKLKLMKHTLWLMIALLSGVTWMLYFGATWAGYFQLSLGVSTFAITGAISLGAYVFAGFMREQSCLWVCPYARIQGAMADEDSLMPTYDQARGEKRGKLKKGVFIEGNGDCIDCHQCVAVCPTGVDIRKGQEYGCITCGLCIDACDAVMQKVGKPTGLVRYASLSEMKFNQPTKALYKRPRVLVYSSILLFALSMLVYGMLNMSGMDFKVLHDRQPLFVQLSDGSIRNKYELKIMNKTDKTMQVKVDFSSQIKALKSKDPMTSVKVLSGDIVSIFVYLSALESAVGENNQVIFKIDNGQEKIRYQAVFFTPRSL
jgi:cytochrome c oxidase accessory protein FixG